VNDLADGINELQCGVSFEYSSVSILMYADDIALLSETAEGLQRQLDYLHQWCYKWRMEINEKKTRVVHYRKPGTDRHQQYFHCGNKIVNIIETYKYLGLWINEFLDTQTMVKELANSATRALGKITVKLKAMGGLTYSGYTKLYNSIVDPILTYASGVWGTKEYKILNTVQNKARRQYLGVPLSNTWGDMCWSSVTSRLVQEV
jgi:hypothetical protein